MSTFLLVHGSWHGAWCWYKIVPRLERAGHTVIVPDLQSHGRDWTPPGQVTLQDYVDRICQLLDEQTEPVILVAHSRGGIIISQVAEQRPKKVSLLVYLAAFLIPTGETVLTYFYKDKDCLIVPNIEINRQQGWDMLKTEAFQAALYADCSAEDIALAQLLLTPEPLSPAATPLQLTQVNFGRIPRVYIELLQDRAVSPALQRLMYTQLPCQQIISIEASHSAYFSKPDALAEHLILLQATQAH